MTGNTDMWVVLAVTGGLSVAWPAVLAVIKPTFIPVVLLALGRPAG